MSTKNKNSKRILSVTIKRMVDDSPDTSWLGEYASKPNSEFSIDRAHSEDCIENDSIQKEKLERIANWLENERPICDDHIEWSGENCETCQEELAYTHAITEMFDLARCDCGERGDMEHGQYRYFNPSDNYKGEPAEDIRKYVRQDYERIESLNRGDWCFLGISAEAEIGIGDFAQYPKKYNCTVQHIHSAGLWGIESDSDDSYLEEIESEQLSELKSELKSLGFSSRAISTAFKTIERKDS